MAAFKPNLLRVLLHNGLRWRESINTFLENASPKSELPEERAIIYALFAIAGVLFLAAVVLGSYIAVSG